MFSELKKQTIAYSGATAEDFREDFSILLEAYLENISDWLEETDRTIDNIFASHNFKVVANDAFSQKFNKEVGLRVQLWISADDVLRKEFRSLVQHYKKIQAAQLKAHALKELETHEENLLAHVNKANEYGTKWTTSADNAGLVIDKQIRRTINWFKNLTLEELKRDYLRGL
jgi:hypothetical protein